MRSVGLLLLLVSVSPAAVRIGYGEARPYNYTAPDGKPAGFLIELFNEAARRHGIALEWVRGGTSAANTKAMVEGGLDMLPMGLANAERQRLLYVSPAWWSEDAILLIRADRGDVDPARPRRLAMPERLSAGASRHYSDAVPVVVASAPAALEQVCRGAADAALLGSTYIHDLVNARPAACESVRLRIFDSPVQVDFSIISSKSLESTAKRLHEAIRELTADGTLTSIAERHPPISAPHTARMAEALRSRYESQRLRMMLAFLSIFLGLSAVMLGRQISAKRRLRAIVEQQAVTERQLRESETALQQRTQELTRSNEELQAFAYSISHDLQEPLRNQAVYSELLERRHVETLPAEARRYLSVIRGSAIRMQHMMRSLLAYSRFGHAETQKTLVDCNDLVRRVLGDLEFQLTKSDARVETGPLPTVWGWEDRLQQVFQNLIENAAKYRKPDVAPVIRIAADETSEGWRFSVSDNGIGFKQQYADRVLGLFKRLHAHGTYDGSGVGLAICRRIVESHGGRIWAESAEGVGSTFYFTVPAKQDGPAEPAPH